MTTTCPKCGAEVYGKFCVMCGEKIPDDEETPREVKRMQMKCNACNGVMTFDSDQSILSCPFCGSKEIVLESDAVAVQKIKSSAQKEIAVEKLHSKERLSARRDDIQVMKMRYKIRNNISQHIVGFLWLIVAVVAVLILIFYMRTLAKMPLSDDSYINQNWLVVKVQLEDAGYKHIEFVASEKGDDANQTAENGSVYWVTVNGNPDFSKGKLYSKKSIIRVYYYSNAANAGNGS